MVSSSVLNERLQYPAARRDDSVVNDYHGYKISDPYRWMEDPATEEVQEFVRKQRELIDLCLGKCEAREKLREEITRLDALLGSDVPAEMGYKNFNIQNIGLQAPNMRYIQDGLDREQEALIDRNTLDEDETVRAFRRSPDDLYAACGRSCNGSDWLTIKVMRIKDHNVEPESETLSWIKFTSISWTHDSKGFFYSRYPAPKGGERIDAGTETDPNLDNELYYHFRGTEQSEDILCYKDPENPKYMFQGSVTDDGKYLLLYISETSDPVNKVYYCDITGLPEGLEGYKGRSIVLPFVKLFDGLDAKYEAIANDDTVFIFLTNKDAPKYKLVRVDLKEPSSWSDVVPEAEKDVLQSAHAVNVNQMILNYLSDVKYVMQIRDLKSGSLLHQFKIDIGSVDAIYASRKYGSFFFKFSSILIPPITYKCDLDSEVPLMSVHRRIRVPGFDHSEFNIHQVFVPSKDGPRIPVFIASKKNITLDGSHPCLLHGYGGFNFSFTPSFAVSRFVLLRHLGFVYCVANIRGGGEYGGEWHKAGARAKKQNCFVDFISVSEYLVSAGYTQPGKLCIEGWSGGGLLVGACINQRPDLFGCALAHVGVMDMLRFHKFTIGHAWTSEFGCSENKEEFNWLIKYSPLHNVRRPWEKHPDKPTQYPSTMLLTADHDDRVVPLHSLKLSATLQFELGTSLDNSPQTNPILCRMECQAGHGAGRPRQKLINEAADRYGFMAKALRVSCIDMTMVRFEPYGLNRTVSSEPELKQRFGSGLGLESELEP